MSARFRCVYCGGPVNAKADGRPLPCPTPTCPCDIGIDPYAHVYRVPEQDGEPLILGFSAPYEPSEKAQYVELYAYEPVGIHGAFLDPNVPRLEHAQRLLWDLYDSGDMDNLHVEGCPEDDTCRCPRAQVLNLVMHGWEPPKVTPTGVHSAPPKMVRADITYALTGTCDKACRRCGTATKGGFCTDESCPFSYHVQQCQRGWIGHPESATDESAACTCASQGTYALRPFPELHSETVPTEVVTTGRSVGKSTAPADYVDSPPPRLVVCAANRNEVGVIAVGARHFDDRMREQMLSFGGREMWFRAEQGFIDQRGAFMTREEAWKVAEAAGQIRRRCGGDTMNGGTLFSENLY